VKAQYNRQCFKQKKVMHFDRVALDSMGWFLSIFGMSVGKEGLCRREWWFAKWTTHTIKTVCLGNGFNWKNCESSELTKTWQFAHLNWNKSLEIEAIKSMMVPVITFCQGLSTT
jgi:hypothetical protein